MSQNVPPQPNTGQKVPKTDKKLTSQRRNIPTETLYHYRKKGLSYADISQLVGITKQSVHQRLQREGLADTSLSDFISTRADMFALVQRRILYSIDDQVIKDAPLGARTLAIAQLYDKERLERGLSTDNLSISSIAVHLQSTLAEHRERSKLLLEAMSERGISSTILQDCSTIDTKTDITDDFSDNPRSDNVGAGL